MTLVRYRDLAGMGIPFSRVHLDRLQQAGKFPRKVKIGENTTAYVREEVEEYIKSRCAERDGVHAA